jgi:hypothetical protein
MLRKIENQEIMTINEATKKYSTQYFLMFITKTVDATLQNDLGYVRYVADKRKELNQVPRDEYKGKLVTFLDGDDTEPFPSLDRVVYYD